MLLAAAAHAAWNLLVRQSGDQLLTLAGLRVVGFPIAIVLIVLFPAPSPEALPFLVGNVLFMYAYYFFLLKSYRLGELSTVYPIARGVAPAAVLVASYLFTIDSFTGSELLATIIVAVGLLLFVTQKNLSAKDASYAIATGLTIAGYTLLAGFGVRHSESTLGYLAWSELLTGLGLIPVAWLKRSDSAMPFLAANFGTILGAGLLSMGAFGVVLWAFNYLPIGPVAAVRETSIAFAALFGWLFLKEPFSKVKGVALLFVVVGVLLLVLD